VLKEESAIEHLEKCPTGIHGLDEITFGGLPKGRTALVCGGAGCGKTLLGMEFLIRGATEFNEPGVCLSFEETHEELTKNVASLGFDLASLIKRRKIVIDFVFIERSLMEEAGEYDLEALFLRLQHAVDSIGAKRVLIDSIESLFAGLSDEGTLRAELRRLFRWLKERGLTAVITGERGEGTLTRHGLEEYISDCVISLDHQVIDAVFTRRLRVVKYRGSAHGTNEYPFLIDDEGLSVFPVTSVALNHGVSNERVSTGVPALDAMLGGKGYFKGSSLLISGTAGTGKTSLMAQFVDAACGRGERCVVFSFEESADQLVRNMKSIGVDLMRWIEKGLLKIHATRPTMLGLEMHLVKVYKIVREFQPSIVTMDPATALLKSGSELATENMLLRMLDFLKERTITLLLTTLTNGGEVQERTSLGISSLMDTWILLRDIESDGERNKGLYVLKARGIAHSNQIREFVFTTGGIELRDVYIGAAGLLTGSARVAQQSKEATEALLAEQTVADKQNLSERRCKAIEAQIAVLRFELESEQQQKNFFVAQERLQVESRQKRREDMIASRSLHVKPQQGAGGNQTKPERSRHEKNR
jgi:circadian clock protein KaiC